MEGIIVHGMMVLAGVLGIIAASAAAAAVVKKYIFSGIYQEYQAGNYDVMLKQLDSRGARAMLPAYTREMMRLNAWICQDEEEQVTAQFNRMMKMGLGGYQMSELLTRGFQYFQGRQDGDKCRKILEKMEEILNPDMLVKYRRHVAVVFDGSVQELEEILREIPEHRGMMRGYLEYLAANCYGSMKDAGNRRLYERRAAADYKTTVSGLAQVVRVI